MAVALLVAAGRGERLGSEGPKALVVVAGRPCSSGRSRRCSPRRRSSEVVVALPPGVEAPAGTVGVEGGAERSHSVRNALAAASGSGPVVIQDAARPLLTPELVERCLAALADADAAVAAAPVVDTTKEADGDGVVVRTLERSRLWAVQTPQVFRRDVLERVLAQPDDVLAAATDEASLVEAAGGTGADRRGAAREPEGHDARRPAGRRAAAGRSPLTAPVRVPPMLLPRVALLAAVVAVLLALPSGASAATKWLCKPGLKGDACNVGLRHDRVLARRREARASSGRSRARGRSTASTSTRPSATSRRRTRTSASTRRSARSREYQAARYTRECRVYAPVYRQTTIAGIQPGASSGGARRLTTDDRAAGRPARGVAHLPAPPQPRARRRADRPLAGHVPAAPADPRRRSTTGRRSAGRIVSAILLGGNVVRGEFDNLPACRTAEPARLRHRLLDLRRDAARRLALRPDRRTAACCARTRRGSAAARRTSTSSSPASRSRPARSSPPASRCSGVEQPTAPTPWVTGRERLRGGVRRDRRQDVPRAHARRGRRPTSSRRRRRSGACTSSTARSRSTTCSPPCGARPRRSSAAADKRQGCSTHDLLTRRREGASHDPSNSRPGWSSSSSTTVTASPAACATRPAPALDFSRSWLAPGVPRIEQLAEAARAP